MKLIVIDRDGTLNPVPDVYVRGAAEWQPMPGAMEAVARLNHAGWHVVVATNQSGLGRGLFDIATLNEVHARLHKALAAARARVDAVFFCPHGPEDGCSCRKPAPGLLQQISRRMGTPLAQIIAAGDAVRDAQAAAAAGCEPHLLLTGRSLSYRDGSRPEGLPPQTRCHLDLGAFADFVIARGTVPGTAPSV